MTTITTPNTTTRGNDAAAEAKTWRVPHFE